ncbi:MAG: ORF6N domain-containing protein, partial [Bacilli bacterium]|nr:ORF6N domain-containing protein [Bacilli bacterium]
DIIKKMISILRSQNVTSRWGGMRYIPYAFTEQGIYMLMTVLKGDVAIKQSIDLINEALKHQNLAL